MPKGQSTHKTKNHRNLDLQIGGYTHNEKLNASQSSFIPYWVVAVIWFWTCSLTNIHAPPGAPCPHISKLRCHTKFRSNHYRLRFTSYLLHGPLRHHHQVIPTYTEVGPPLQDGTNYTTTNDKTPICQPLFGRWMQQFNPYRIWWSNGASDARIAICFCTKPLNRQNVPTLGV